MRGRSEESETSINLIANREFLEMDLTKIREFVKILEDHQFKCENQGRFVEAEMAYNRVRQFKKIMQAKELLELKASHQDENKYLEEEQLQALNMFNQEYDRRFYEISNKFEELENRMKEQHNKEIEDKTNEFEEMFVKCPQKAAPEILNLSKILETLVKKKEYSKAHQCQLKIIEITNRNANNWITEKEKKLRKELEKMKIRQDNELNNLHLRMNQAYNEFKKKRAIEFDKLVQRYKNKHKELENFQKYDILEVKRPVHKMDYMKTRPKSKFNEQRSTMHTKNFSMTHQTQTRGDRPESSEHNNLQTYNYEKNENNIYRYKDNDDENENYRNNEGDYDQGQEDGGREVEGNEQEQDHKHYENNGNDQDDEN